MTDEIERKCPRCGHTFAGGEIVNHDQLALAELELTSGQEHLALEEPPAFPSSRTVSAEPDPPMPPADREEARGAIPRPAPPLHVQERLDVEHDKPVYRIPLMAEIAQTERHGLTVMSTFSGCGGSCLGFKMAGFTTLAASEFVPAAQDTYRANFPDVPLIVGDVRDLEPELVMARLGLERGELDVLEGSPPCASFSMAGKREAGWGLEKKYSDVKQRTDDLFDEYVRLVDGFWPRVFVAENVAGFLYGAAAEFKEWVREMLDELGYHVAVKLVDAARHGVPQRRKRTIILGVRRDVQALGVHPAALYPRGLPYWYSVRDAIGVPEGSRMETMAGDFSPTTQSVEEPAPTMNASGGFGNVTNRHLLIPGESEELPGLDEEAVLIHDTKGQHTIGRLNLDEPIPTITVSDGYYTVYESEEAVPPEFAAGSVSHTQGEIVGAPAQDIPGLGADDELVYRGQPGGREWQERRRSLDVPAPAVTADGIAGSASHRSLIVSEGDGQLGVEEPQEESPFEGVVGLSASGHGRLRVVKGLDEPADTIQTSARGDAAGAGWVYELGTEEEIEATSIEGMAIGDAYDDVEIGGQSERYFNLVRPDPEQPSPTVTQTGGQLGAASVVHPTQKRKFTIAELRRICAFPDDFVLTGTYRQQWERLGRAVPPPMMHAIASSIRDALLEVDHRLDEEYE